MSMETTPNQESSARRLSQSARQTYWRVECESWQKSGLSFKAYASERGYSWYSLRDWQQRFNREQESSVTKVSDFREVRVNAAPSSYELEFSNGKKLRVSGGFSIERVKQLVELLSC